MGELRIEVKEVKLLVVLCILRVVVCTIRWVVSLGLILGLQMIKLQLLIVNVKCGLSEFLLDNLVLFFRSG